MCTTIFFSVLFEDEEIAEKILKTPDPREQKALGRQVRNFQDDKWIANCRDIVKQANYAKVISRIFISINACHLKICPAALDIEQLLQFYAELVRDVPNQD